MTLKMQNKHWSLCTRVTKNEELGWTPELKCLYAPRPASVRFFTGFLLVLWFSIQKFTVNMFLDWSSSEKLWNHAGISENLCLNGNWRSVCYFDDRCYFWQPCALFYSRPSDVFWLLVGRRPARSPMTTRNNVAHCVGAGDQSSLSEFWPTFLFGCCHQAIGSISCMRVGVFRNIYFSCSVWASDCSRGIWVGAYGFYTV